MRCARGWLPASWKRRSRAIRDWRIANSVSSPAPARCSKRRPPKRAALGVTPLILGDAIEGEAREVGKALAGMAVSPAVDTAFPAKSRCVLLSGGETTVTLKGERARRAQYGIPARPDAGARRRPGHSRTGGRYRRHRRLRRQCRRLRRAGQPAPGARTGPRYSQPHGRQRCLGLFLGARRPAGHRPDTDQRK